MGGNSPILTKIGGADPVQIVVLLTMLKLILYGLLIWFLYNLVFRFIIPIYKTTRQMKQKFREMQEQMNPQQDFSAEPQNHERPPEKVRKGDYIDFEEVK